MSASLVRRQCLNQTTFPIGDSSETQMISDRKTRKKIYLQCIKAEEIFLQNKEFETLFSC